MGRKCWESIPEKFRPLPKRTNIVITRDVDYIANGAEISHNLIELLEKYKDTDDEIFVIGGAEIYKEAFKYASKFYLTRIFEEIDGDIFLEGFDINEWKWIDSSDMSEENSYKFRFEFYSKIYEL
jgi:dihydrofolate reductase